MCGTLLTIYLSIKGYFTRYIFCLQAQIFTRVHYVIFHFSFIFCIGLSISNDILSIDNS